MQSRVIEVIEEQISVQFTGKVNILSSFNRQFFGHILFKNGDVIQVSFQNHKGLKGFYQLIVDEYALHSFDYVVEPELVDENERQIHYPFSVIKNKLADVMKLYRESIKLRPPENVKILIDAGFLEDTIHVNPEEFEVLKALTEWSSPADIYQNCSLLDHEVTISLVSLRKTGALKILAPRQDTR